MANNIEHIRHSLAHLLAASVLELYPHAKPTIGPAIENGFYYDFDNIKISDTDLPKIEKRMKKLLPSWKNFEGHEVSANEARKQFKDNPYKLELIDELEKDSATITLYTSGAFTDLCRGGHVKNPAKDINPDAFTLEKTAGAYWRGDEKNQMLTRIYGLAFPTKKELDEYIKRQAEAVKRDHKKLGPALDLFFFHETAPGSPYWLPKGLVILNELIDFWRAEHKKRDYLETSTPLVNKKELWEISGHWKHYQEDMFIADMGKNEVYGIKPMNCPNAMVIFQSKSRSYRDLPLRLSDADILHRYERSGTLNGLLRARSFRQDDSHNYITEDQIESEYREILEIADLFYGVFGFEYQLRLGTRPEGFLGDLETWNKAEKALHSILKEKVGDGKYEIAEGDGAFYGPKIDIVMKDSLGRDWQMGTVQLDFQQPKRFGLVYTDKDGKEKTPVVVHRVIYGSLERFIAILVEHYAGAFPLWLSPVQMKILPIGETHEEYAREVAERLRTENIRVELDDSNETLGKKIRNWKLEKVPYALVIGDEEVKSKKLKVESRDDEKSKSLTLKQLTEKLQKETEEKH